MAPEPPEFELAHDSLKRLATLQKGEIVARVLRSPLLMAILQGGRYAFSESSWLVPRVITASTSLRYFGTLIFCYGRQKLDFLQGSEIYHEGCRTLWDVWGCVPALIVQPTHTRSDLLHPISLLSGELTQLAMANHHF